MELVITNIIAVITAVLLLIFALFTITLKKGRRIKNLLLSFFLLSNAIYIIDYLLPFLQQYLNLNLTLIDGIGSAFGFLVGPLLFMFTCSLTDKASEFKLFQLFHFVPFAIVILMILINFRISWQLQYTLLHIQLIPYMIACIYVLIRYTKTLKEYYSSLVKLNLNWMLYVIGGFFLMWLVDLANFILSRSGLNSDQLYNNLLIISLSINFVFAVLIFYKALQHPEFFTEFAIIDNSHKYEGSKLNSEEKKTYLNTIQSYFQNEKPFLNPSLTISDVARATGINTKYVSQVINESLNKNFYDFINSYRIEEAKMRLCENGKNEKTVLEILYDSGFNSKSAFNSAFKKFTGLTPTDYRNHYSSTL